MLHNRVVTWHGIPFPKAKKEKEPTIVGSFLMVRKERDSNPRNLSVQRFSRPPRSTTPPSFRNPSVVIFPKSAAKVVQTERSAK